MLGFAQIISVRGGDLPVSVQFLCEGIKIKGCTAFLSKVKHKFVNNSCSN